MQATNGTVEAVAELKDAWALLFPTVAAPDDTQWTIWLLRHDRAIVRRGLAELATKYKRVEGKMDALYMGKFASAVMNRLDDEELAR
ncbi:MAG: hypothetical protein M3O02_03880 [Acidobacteriota bacterium]|nr:hypothetical protein [Acidobacteriota bacterium]